MCASSTFDTLTYHRELREAQLDTDFNHILVQLRSEWYYTGTLVRTTLFVFLSFLWHAGAYLYLSYFPLLRGYFQVVCVVSSTIEGADIIT